MAQSRSSREELVDSKKEGNGTTSTRSSTTEKHSPGASTRINTSTSSTTSSGQRPPTPSPTAPPKTPPPSSPPKPTILFLIFCGGPSGMADMNAILETWGKRVDKAVIMSNTPDNLPTDKIRQRHWKIRGSSTLQGGPLRNPKSFWQAAMDVIHAELVKDASIQWIVRSDSDTWWNVPLLHQELMERTRSLLPSHDPLMMGQFFPLVDGKWVRSVSAKAITKGMDRDSGRNAYLSGGAGVVFTRAAIERFYDCLHSANGDSVKSSGKEDFWLSNLAFACHVTLVRHGEMYQFGTQVVSKAHVPKTLTAHRAAGDGRKGYRHPSWYENALLKRERQQQQQQPKQQPKVANKQRPMAAKMSNPMKNTRQPQPQKRQAMAAKTSQPANKASGPPKLTMTRRAKVKGKQQSSITRDLSTRPTRPSVLLTD